MPNVENSIERQIEIKTPVSKVTASRRAEAFKMHTGGWEAQLKNIEAFLVEKK
jgi:hypothetical protein